MKRTPLFITLALLIAGCIVIEEPFTKLPPGKWVGILKLDKEISGAPIVKQRNISPIINFEPVNSGELPFEFEVRYTDPDNFEFLLINGVDTFVTTDIIYGTDRSKAKDTFEIHFPMYNTLLKGFYEEDVMEGVWIVGDKEDYSIPFVAHFGRAYKFTELKKAPLADLSGIWAIDMGVDKEESTPLIAHFKQNGNELTGSFSGKSGDYRFLSGTVQGNKVYLSQFDGATAYLIEAKIEEDGTLTGLFRSGKHYEAIWTGKRDENKQLDLYKHSSGVIGRSAQFQYLDDENNLVSIEDPKFQGKPKVLQIFGSWCHNCYDEGRLFSKIAEENKEDLVFIGLAVERSPDTLAALNRVRAFRKATGINYPLLLASTTTKKEEVLRAIPFMDDIAVYPTTIYLDQNNKIQAITSGFFGPASHLHQGWKNDFLERIERLKKGEPLTF